jgi:hypothetical protein
LTFTLSITAIPYRDREDVKVNLSRKWRLVDILSTLFGSFILGEELMICIR